MLRDAKLESVCIRLPRVTDDVATALLKVESLRQIWIECRSVEPGSLQLLQSHPSLSKLLVIDGGAVGEELDRLSHKRPDLKVETRGRDLNYLSPHSVHREQ